MKSNLEARFQELFETLLEAPERLAWFDVVVNGNGNSFADIEFLMAEHEDGSTYIYSSRNGNDMYSLMTSEGYSFLG